MKAEKAKFIFLVVSKIIIFCPQLFLHKTSISFSLFKSISIYASIYLCTLGEGFSIYKKFYLKIGFYFFMTLYILGVPGADASYCCLPLFYAKSLEMTLLYYFSKTFIDLNSLYEFSLLPDIFK